MKKCERGAVLRGEVPWGEIPWFHGAKVVAPERGMDKLGGGWQYKMAGPVVGLIT